MGELGKGEYLLAWYVGGQRCSNVARFRIDEDLDANKLSLLELAELETREGQGAPTLILRARRHAEKDPAPLSSDVAFPTLSIDGQDRTTGGMAWVGADGPLAVGGHYAHLIDLKYFTWDPALKQKVAPIDANTARAIFAKVGRQAVEQSLAIRLVNFPKLGEAWDLETAKLPPMPSQESSISFSGSVLDLQGKPGRDYEVSLVGEDGVVYNEKADAAGKYQFRRLPPGTYKLRCGPPAMGQPELSISGVTIEANKTLVKDMSMEGKYLLVGRAIDATGKPVAGVTIDLSCEDKKVGAEFGDTTRTDAQGRYRLASPLGVVSYIGVSGKGAGQSRINGAMPKLAPGENAVDFVADKGHYRAAMGKPAAREESSSQPVGGGGPATGAVQGHPASRPVAEAPVSPKVLAAEANVSLDTPDPSLLDVQVLKQAGYGPSAVENGLLLKALAEAMRQYNEDSQRPAGVTPPLNADLARFDALRAGEDTPFDKAEALAASLLEQYKSDLEHGRIYAALTHLYGQSGSEPKTIDWARKTLEYPIDPRVRLRMYEYWGDAAFLKDFRELRAGSPAACRGIALPYLLGLRQAMRYNLPEETPDLPRLDIRSFVDPAAPKLPDLPQQARVVAVFTREMVQLRDTLAGQLAGLGILGPAFSGKEAEAMLRQPAAIESLADRHQAR